MREDVTVLLPQADTQAPIGSPQLGGHLRRVMTRFDAFDEDRVTRDAAGPESQDLSVRRGVVPRASLGHAWELDDDQGAGPGTFTHFDGTAVHDEPAR